MFTFNFQIFSHILHRLIEKITTNQKSYLLRRAKMQDKTFLTLIGGSNKNISNQTERYEDKEMNGDERNEMMTLFRRRTNWLRMNNKE